jgi:signal recognition particle subunit SRP54
MRGKFSLKDMYKQMEAMNKMGPLKQIMQMLPMGGMGLELSDKEYQLTKDRLDKYRVIMDSMTNAELDDPKIITANRIKRISRGSGTSPELVRELLKSHQAMQKTIKGMRGGMGKMNMKRLLKKFGGQKADG